MGEIQVVKNSETLSSMRDCFADPERRGPFGPGGLARLLARRPLRDPVEKRLVPKQRILRLEDPMALVGKQPYLLLFVKSRNGRARRQRSRPVKH